MRGLFGSDEMLAIALTRDGHPTKKSEVDNLCKERPEWLTKWARKEWKFRLDATEANLKRLKLIPEDAKRG